MKVEVNHTGEHETIDGYDSEFVISRINVHRTHSCMAKPSEVGVSSSVMTTFAAYGDNIRKMSGSLLQGMGASVPAAPGVQTLTVRARNDSGDAWVLAEVADTGLSAYRFQPPAHYECQAIDMGER